MPNAVSFARTSRVLERDSDRVSRWGLLVGMALLAVWTAWFAFGHVTVWQSSRSARLEVADAAQVMAAAAGGRLLALRVRPGQQVRAGDVLAELDAEPLRLRLAATTARLAAYPARIAALEAELAASGAATRADSRAARSAVAAARARNRAASDEAGFRNREAQRAAGDAADGSLAQSDAEHAASEARQKAAISAAAGSEADRADALGAVAAAERDEDAARLAARLADLRAEAEATRAEVAALRLAVANQVIRAPVGGTIGDVAPLRTGELLAAGARIATLVPTGGLQVVAAFDPGPALGRLAAGQSARMRLDGRDWAEFGDLAGTVERVAAEPGGDGALRVDLRLARASDARLRPRHGMTGAVDVAVEQVSPATLVLRAIGRALG